MSSDEKRYDNRAFDQVQQPLPPSYPSQQYPQGGPPTAMAYGGNYPSQQGGVVMVTQPQPGMVAVGQPLQTGNATSALALAVVTLCCFGNIIFGLIALLFWYEADQAFKRGDATRGQQKKKTSIIISIVAIVISVVIIIAVVVLYVVVFTNTRRYYDGLY